MQQAKMDTDIAIRTGCINIPPICSHSQCCNRLAVALYKIFHQQSTIISK